MVIPNRIMSPQSPIKGQRKMIFILQEDAVNLLIALGAKEQLVRKWSNDKLTLKLRALKEVPQSEFEGMTGREKETLDAVTASFSNKERFRVGEPSTPRVKKVKAEKEGTEKSQKADRLKNFNKEKYVLDEFGMREGTGGAIINTVLSDRYPMKDKEILERCGVATTRSRISGHMRKLKERGLVEKTKEGWVVRPGVISKKRKNPSDPAENVTTEKVKEEVVVTPAPESVPEPVKEDTAECVTVEQTQEVNPDVVA